MGWQFWNGHQVADLELTDSFPLCHHAACRTHLRDIIIVIHGDNFSSVAKSNFDPSAVSELTRLESEISFLHVWWSSLRRCGGLVKEVWWSNKEVWWSS